MLQPFKKYFYPFLLALFDGSQKKVSEISLFVCDFFCMSSEEKTSLTKGGGITKHNSRINYCASYLKQMGFVETTKRGYYSITPKGNILLKTFGESLTLDSIKNTPEYIELQKGNNETSIDRILIPGHNKNGKFIPPYYCNVSQVGAKLRDKLLLDNSK